MLISECISATAASFPKTEVMKLFFPIKKQHETATLLPASIKHFRPPLGGKFSVGKFTELAIPFFFCSDASHTADTEIP